MSNKLQDKILEQNILCNVLAWHEKGIKGQGITVWVADSNSSHGETASECVRLSAPQCNIVMGSIGVEKNGETFSNAKVNGGKIEDFIEKHNVKIIVRPKEQGFARKDCIGYHEYWKELKEKYNLILINSVGNEGNDGQYREQGNDVALLIGAVRQDKNGKFAPCDYSEVTSDIDYVEFAGIWSGTSFSAPYFAGKVALLCQFFGDRTQEEIIKIIDEAVVRVDGARDKVGKGVYIMGEPKSIIKIKIGENTMLVNGKRVKIDQPAIISKDTNRTLVPIRAIAESLGASVQWDNETREITIEL